LTFQKVGMTYYLELEGVGPYPVHWEFARYGKEITQSLKGVYIKPTNVVA
jgi:hypothetical protein